MARKIFISYRREDSADHVHGIAQYLDRELGRGTVFLDVDMHAGVHFPQELERRLTDSAAMIALIGPRWLEARDETGRRRLDDPNDWVRLEISRAIVRGIPVVPVLVGGAQLPERSSLPTGMQGLLEHQAASVSSRSFRNDMAGLVRDLAATRGRKLPGKALIALAVLVMIGAAGLVVWRSGAISGYSSGSGPAVTAARPATTASPTIPTSPDDVLAACVKDQRHPDGSAVIEGLVKRFTDNRFRYGWRVETDDKRPRASDSIQWQEIQTARQERGMLVLQHSYRNGRLRLVPVVKRKYSTRSFAAVSLVLQGLWSSDNGYGCAEVTFDGNGRGQGRIGVMTSSTLDTDVFIRQAD